MAPWTTQSPRLKDDCREHFVHKLLVLFLTTISKNSSEGEKIIKHFLDSVGRQLMEKCLFKDEKGSLSKLVKCKCR